MQTCLLVASRFKANVKQGIHGPMVRRFHARNRIVLLAMDVFFPLRLEQYPILQSFGEIVEHFAREKVAFHCACSSSMSYLLWYNTQPKRLSEPRIS